MEEGEGMSYDTAVGRFVARRGRLNEEVEWGLEVGFEGID